jgi:hypothetical protein
MTIHYKMSIRLAQAALVLFLSVFGWLSLAPLVAIQSQSGISSPAAGAAVSGDVAIIGTAMIDPFQKYELHYKLEPSGDDAYIYFDGNTVAVNGGQLGVWRASALAPGVYTLRLRVVKVDGNYAEFFAPNLSVNQGPPPTPTPSEPTPTPTASEPTATYTPAPTPTPVIGQVEQPLLPEPTPTATPAAVALVDPNQPAAPAQPAGSASGGGTGVIVNPNEPSVAGAARDLGEALSLDNLRQRFFTGMRFSAAIFIVVLALYGGKRVFQWARRRYA